MRAASEKNELKELIPWLGLGIAGYTMVKYVLPKLNTPAHLLPVNTNINNGAYAFVANPSGAMLFERTDPSLEPLYGHGRDPLSIKLSEGTYIGKLTGITYHELVQVRTNIDDSDVAFWVKMADIRTGSGSQMDMANVLQKTQADLRTIAHSLIDKLKI